MPRVAYVSSYSYASGPANDVRSQGVLDALRGLGCEVDVMEEPGRLSGSWRRLPARGPLGRAARLGGLGSGVDEWLGTLEGVPDVIWLYGLDIRFSSRVMRWARRRGVPVVCEVVDWYQVRDMSGVGPRAVLALTNLVAMPWARRSAAGFVVASRELAAYFADRSPVTARIPAVIPPASVPRPPRSAVERLVVGYVGSPGKRDGLTLHNLQVVARTWDGPPLEVHIAGAPPPAVPWETGPQVQVVHHGRVPRDRAIHLVAQCDATVLQRPGDRRFARSGFPSKVAESMVLGTAPVTNATSDLGLELTSGRDSIVLDDESAGALRRGLEQLARSPIDPCEVARTGQERFSVQAAERRIHHLFSSMEVS